MELLPRITEKTYAEEPKHTYVFRVPAGASKQAIAKAVEEEFSVHVTDVRTLTRKGKKTRFSRGKHAYPGTTFRQDKHIAYVTIKADEKIPVFEDLDNQADASDDEKTSSKKPEPKDEKGDKK